MWWISATGNVLFAVELPRERDLGNFPYDAAGLRRGVFRNSESLVECFAVAPVYVLAIDCLVEFSKNAKATGV